ncbi:phosphatase PAP2 family protein [Georgenia sp. MJ206]|uniref:phosphatase PAP2 family protein n=1 Tax=Georgenia wangjunii TaxID=3117730 RepID=UPI002F25F0C3
MPPSSTARRGAARRAAALALAVCALSALGVLALWWLFVTTAPGQRVEEIALEGSSIGRWRLAEGTQAVLDVVSVPFLALVTLAGVAAAALRRQWLLAVAVPLMVGGANVATQLLKYEILTRPDVGMDSAHANSLPSGHTTVAASVAAVAVLVAPPRWRWLAALAGWGYAGGTGLATMVNGWHRASDVAAGLLVALAAAALALAVVGPSGPGRDHSPTAATTSLLLSAAGVTGAVALVALALTWAGGDPVDAQGRGALLLAYGGACAGIIAVTCAAAGALLRLGTTPDDSSDGVRPHGGSTRPGARRPPAGQPR